MVWDTFVYSTIYAGFTYQNKCLEVVFEYRAGAGGRIEFHRPHPDPTIDPVMMRAMGWRMNKWFGWVRETFVLVQK